MTVDTLMRKAFSASVNYVIRRHRITLSNKFLNEARSIGVELTKEEVQEVKDYWHDCGIKSVNLEFFKIYKAIYGRFDKRFIPDDIYFSIIDMFFNDDASCKVIDNKNLYNLFFPDVKMPRTILRKMDGVLLDGNYNLISFDEALHLCQQAGNIIRKPSLMSCGGHGIRFWNTTDGLENLKKRLNSRTDFVVQEMVKSHPELEKLHKDSLNTIRMVTLFFHNQVYYLSAVVRMGVDGKKVDNLSSGGLACGIQPDGRLKKYACYINGKSVEKHPQGTVFSDITIPHFAECVATAKRLAPRLIDFSKLVSWDFAIDAEGNPVLIEANMSGGGLDLHQMCNGPLFGDLTEDVLKEVFKK